MPLTSLDLFTGCGGMTRALEGISTPLAYCEVDGRRQTVLHSLMRKGKIPVAPLHADIRTFRHDGPIPDMVAGSWPCFPAGALVTTQKGYVRIEELVDHDKVLTHSGTYRRILNLQRKTIPPGRLVRIEAKGHFRPIQCTEEHPFYVIPKDEPSSKPVWMQAKHLTDRYMVGLPVDQRSIVPDFHPIRMTTYDHMWAAGYFLGDGWIVDSGHRTYYVINNEQVDDAVQRLRRVVPNLNFAEKCQGCVKYVTTNKAWWSMCKQFGRYAHGKVVPDWVHAAPADLVQGFLDGYVAADGHTRVLDHSKTQIRATTVSRDVALSVQRLFAKLGHAFGIAHTPLPPKTVICGRTVNQRDRYTVHGTVPNAKGVGIRHGCVWFGISYTTRVLTGEPIEVYNLAVDTDESYCVDNTACHNCKGFSKIGKRNGFEHAESALFREYARIVRETRPKFLFQENVPAVTAEALDEVIAAFAETYDLIWATVPAFMVGAPHRRRRWFCLGIRKDVRDYTLSDLQQFEGVDWGSEPCSRMIHIKPNPHRICMLGNAVVPECCRLAFLLLFTGFSVPVEELKTRSTVSLKRPDTTGLPPLPPANGPAAIIRQHGCTIDGANYKINFKILKPPRSHVIELDPATYRGETTRVPKERILTAPIKLQFWATPRGGISTPAHVLTGRGARDLCTQLRYERRTPDDQRSGRANPNFVEWLMGLPQDWTKAD